MRIVLIGYGRMGVELEKQALERGHQIVGKFYLERPLTSDSDLSDADVLIDFSTAAIVPEVLRVASQQGVPVVEGTTGWYDQLEQCVAIPNLTLLYSPNFSPGVYQFLEVVRIAARRLAQVGGYDAFVHEWHHAGKADSPGGTAGRMAEILLEELPEKELPLYDTCHRRIEPRELHVTSTRVGRVPGTHLVGFDSNIDSIELKHTAHGRQGFAFGAILGAEWIAGRKGIFTMDDFMKSIQTSQ